LNHYLKLIGSAVMVMLLFALSGCGQKGDLYLPNIPPVPAVMGSVLNSGSGLSGGPVLNGGPLGSDENSNLVKESEQDASSRVVSDENLDENEKGETKQSKLLESPMTSEPESRP
jgi:hypothetical protein